VGGEAAESAIVVLALAVLVACSSGAGFIVLVRCISVYGYGFIVVLLEAGCVD
jgi:hypothetical protein